jgi:hypothetical protein
VKDASAISWTPNVTAREETETEKVEYILSSAIEVSAGREKNFSASAENNHGTRKDQPMSHGFKPLQAPLTACGNHKDFLFEVLTTSGLHPILVKLFGCHSAGQGGHSSLTIDTMCQNPFETIRPYSSPNG